MKKEENNILIVVGSARYNSTSYLIANSLHEFLSKKYKVTIFNGIGLLPVFNEDMEGGDKPESVAMIELELKKANIVFICTPEYNSSIPGGLKNLFDWTSRPHGKGVFRDKKIIPIVHTPFPAGGYGAYTDICRILSHMGNHVIYNKYGRVHGFRAPDGPVLKTWDDKFYTLISDALR